jgi:hypothetical protein
MRCRLLVWLLAGCLATIGVERLVPLIRSDPPINRHDYAKIKAGMTQSEVTALLGPAGDYREELRVVWTRWSSASWGDMAGEQAIWFGDLGTIQVAFTRNGTIGGAAFYEPEDWVRPQRSHSIAFDWWTNLIN